LALPVLINALMLLLTSYLSRHFGYHFTVDGFIDSPIWHWALGAGHILLLQSAPPT
jgi:hypothetical protein